MSTLRCIVYMSTLRSSHMLYSQEYGDDRYLFFSGTFYRMNVKQERLDDVWNMCGFDRVP